jgi:hypothetical protein
MTIIVPTAQTGAAIQAAINALQARTDPDPYGSRPTVRLERKTYVLDAPLQIAATDLTNIEIVGAGSTYATKLVAGANFPPNTPFINVVISPGAYGAQNDFILRDFMIDCAGVQDAAGIRISATTENGSFTANTVQNVAIANAKYGVQIFNARQINFEHCGIWQQNVVDAIGVLISTDQNGNAGDVNFNECNIVCKPDGNSRGMVLKAVGPSNAAGGQLKGVGFNNSVINQATGYVDIVAESGGQVGDIWFNPRCQFDGAAESTHTGRGFDVSSTGAGSMVDDLNIAGMYFRGLWASQATIKMTASGGGKIGTSSIIDNWVANTSQPFIELTNVDGAVVSGNRIYAVGGGGGASLDHYIGFYNCRGFACTGNVATQLDRATYWGVRLDAACNRFAVTGNVFYGAVNIGNVDNPTSASVERVVSANA